MKKIKILKKWKRCLEILSLYTCVLQMTYHMMYGSSNIKHDIQNFLSIWAVFCPFTPLKTWKIRILKKQKNTWRHHLFTLVHHRWQSYDVLFLRYAVRQTNFCYFRLLFSLLPPTNCGNQNFEKMKKNAWRYHFTHVNHKWKSYDPWFLRYGLW